MRGLRNRAALWLAGIAGTGVVLAAATLALVAARLPALTLEPASAVSATVLDRNDQLLRAFTTEDGRWRLPVAIEDVDPRYLAMLEAYEDRRFQSHWGVDGRALVRAGLQLVRNRHIISGGSTLTMQVARLLDHRHERTGLGKLEQIVRALQLEHRLSKREILTLYLRLAPFGGNIEGVRAASLAYFGKEPKHLSPGEAALLVALPQAPEIRRPDRHAGLAKRARDRVLARSVAAHIVPAAEAARARLEAVPTARREFPKLAPHLTQAEVKRDPAHPVHRLTIDAGLQRTLQELAETRARPLGPRVSAAILALDHTSGEILAYVGSAGHLEDRRQGAVDMVKAIRSPGSTLKPLIYGLGFEDGLIHPQTLIEDRPVRYGSYAPRNFDDDFHGTVTIREALDQSYNIPAVKVLRALGPARLTNRLRRLRIVTALPARAQPTLAIALGGIGMRLQDLAQLYASLAEGGKAVPIIVRRDEDGHPIRPIEARRGAAQRRLLTPLAAWYVSDILKDAPPPADAPAARFAYKTGTSYGYRDAWAIGYDGRHTVAVWVGRADGSPTPGLTGRTAAAPILFDAFARLGPTRAPLQSPPAGAIRVSGAELPLPLKRFREGGDEVAASGAFLEPPVAIAFPPDRAEVEVESSGAAVAGEAGGSEALEPVTLRADGGALPLTWLVDGAPIQSDPNKREASWSPGSRGFVKLSVIDAKGRVDRVAIRLR